MNRAATASGFYLPPAEGDALSVGFKDLAPTPVDYDAGGRVCVVRHLIQQVANYETCARMRLRRRGSI